MRAREGEGKEKKKVATILKSSWQQGMERRRGADKETANNKKRERKKSRETAIGTLTTTRWGSVGERQWKETNPERKTFTDEGGERREEKDKGGPVRNFFLHRTGLFLLSLGMRERLYVMLRTQSPRKKVPQ